MNNQLTVSTEQGLDLPPSQGRNLPGCGFSSFADTRYGSGCSYRPQSNSRSQSSTSFGGGGGSNNRINWLVNSSRSPRCKDSRIGASISDSKICWFLAWGKPLGQDVFPDPAQQGHITTINIRKQIFQVLPDFFSQGRTAPAGGYGDDQVTPVDLGGNDKIAFPGLIHDVA